MLKQLLCTGGRRSRYRLVRLLTAGLMLSLFLPSIVYAQACNPLNQIGASDFGPLAVPTGAITVDIEIGANQTNPGGGTAQIPFVEYALDCQNGGVFSVCTSDDQIVSYMGDGTISTNCTDGTNPVTFTSNVPAGGSATNALVFTPNNPVVVPYGFSAINPNTSCNISFDVQILTLSTDATPNTVQSASAYDLTCSTGGTAEAQPTLQISVVDPDIEIVKEVSVDGGSTWHDANSPPGPTALLGANTEYRLTVTNTGDETLTNVQISDAALSLTDVPIPASCGDLVPMESCVILSGDTGFANLGADRCGTPGLKENTATVNGVGVGSGAQVSDSDPANLTCLEPEITVTKDGPPLAKAGDMITYTICVQNTGDAAVQNCTGDDTVIGPLGAFNAPAVGGVAVCRDFMHTIPADTPNDPVDNVATITCDVVDADATVDDSDDHSVNLFQPSIEVSKTGPEKAKVGDEVCYDIGFENTSSADTPALVNCTGDDSLLGDLGVTFVSGQSQQFCREVLVGDPDPLVNEVTITCGVEGFDNTPSGSDTHSVDLFQPSIEVTKSGPTAAKVGDEVCYDIGFENTSSADTPALVNCTGDDSLLGDLGVTFVSGQSQQFCRTVGGTDPNPLVNEVTITCGVDGFDNTPSDSDTHSVDLFEVVADLTKVCRPNPVNVGGTIEWDITITNTGGNDIECLVDDVTADLVDEPCNASANGGTCNVGNSRTVLSEDAPIISNTATATCDAVGFDNAVELVPAMADCEVIEIVEFCRTPGFWGTHAGTSHPRSTDLTQLVIDAGGGSLSICGQTISNTDLGNVNSALEAMCVSVKGVQQRQLARQLTAAALNCIVSGGGTACEGTSIETLFADANAACEANAGDLTQYIDAIDAFNNSEECGDEATNFSDFEVFNDVDPLPGPAGSGRDCGKATTNDTYVVPAN